MLKAINFVRTEERAYVLAYEILPDHMHLLVAPQGDATLATVMKAIKSFSAREINSRLGLKGPVWQPSFYDCVIRDEEQLETTIHYIHRNAVAAGLSTTPEEYVFSSAHPDAEVGLEAFFGQVSS